MWDLLEVLMETFRYQRNALQEEIQLLYVKSNVRDMRYHRVVTLNPSSNDFDRQTTA